MLRDWINIVHAFDGLTWNQHAYDEGISAVTGHTTADGAVINDHTISVEPAWAWAGVHAFVVLAR